MIGIPTVAIVAALGLAVGTYSDDVPHAVLVRAVVYVAASCIAVGALCLALTWRAW
ncbi:hypothetical protein ABT071_13850 [Streptomyces sp. NPDC002506]|uniref:hypothetical protein n=1 Tax=Streptomyces sp. NPDC002506 TaxID=3154536 RepID=UPI00331A492B